MKTYVPKLGEVEKKWHLVDATGKSMGRIAAEVAKLLRGKHKPQFTPFLDCGDNVVVINADKIKITGKDKAKFSLTITSLTANGLSVRLK